MLNAEIGNSFDVAQGTFDSLAMLGTWNRKKLNKELTMYVVSGLVYIHYYALGYPLLGHKVQGPFVLAHVGNEGNHI